ncbi:MAG: BamA/TamA family outer membrane protein [Longimonas sp.]|uniref:BamA/TamA family outer membrane protein n=1 Tax=Longimonas sp. TaxID=2039626 RepID=UPI003357B3B1
MRIQAVRVHAVAFVLVLCIVLWAPGAFGQDAAAQDAAAQNDAEQEASVWVNPRPYLANIWGPRTGFGMGAGLSVHNLGGRGSRGLVTALVGQHQQVGTVAWSPQWRHRILGFTVVEGRVFHTRHGWFYGVGPFPQDDTRLSLHRTQLRGGVRGRYLPFGTSALRVHAQLHVVHDRIYDQRDDDDNAFSRLDTASQAYLLSFGRSRDGSVGTRTLTGVRPQLGLALDTRDREHGPNHGVLAHVQVGRYLDLSGGVNFWSYEADLAGHVSLTDRQTLDLTANARVARGVDGSSVPPPYLSALDAFRMPGVARGRFLARDRVLLGARYRVVARNIGNLLVLEPYVGGHAGAVYNDVFEQFAFDATIERTPLPTPGVPLRVSGHVGVRVAPFFRDTTFFDLALGLGPDGITGVRLRFTPTFRHLRPDHHNDRW